MLSELSEEEGCVFATALWFIWFARNQLVFQEMTIDTEKLLGMIHSYRRDFNTATSVISGRSSVEGEGKGWQLPLEGMLKLNCDAAVVMGIGAAVGGVLRDHAVVVAWCFAERCFFFSWM